MGKNDCRSIDYFVSRHAISVSVIIHWIDILLLYHQRRIQTASIES